MTDSSKNRFDANTHTMYLSTIFDWFAVDFEAASGSVPAFVAQYVDFAWVVDPNTRIEHLDYDWSLNQHAPAR